MSHNEEHYHENYNSSGKGGLMKRFIMVLTYVMFVGTITFGFLFVPGVAGAVPPQSNCGKWIIIPSPNPGTFNVLSRVAAISSSDSWAVGRTAGGNGINQTLTEHWDGTGWTVISSPNPGMDNTLAGVAAISQNDVWAVGVSENGKSFNTLIEHWDGTSWTIVPSHDPGTNDLLDGVAAISQNDVWAVGSSGSQTLTEHWNGKKWSIVPSLNIPGSGFNGVSSVPNSTNLWAVGNYVKGMNSIEKTLIGQWNGTNWSKVNSPNVSKKDSGLSSVTALSVSNAWAVGGALDPNTSQAQALIEQWNGSKWRIVSSPLVNGFLNGVTIVPSSSIVWAVGTTSSGQTVTESYCSK